MAVHSRIVKAHPDAIKALRTQAEPGPHLAAGFKARKALNLKFRGGRTLPDLRYRNIYLGHWSTPDRDNIDHALAGAMMDPGLNHVMAEYFPGTSITTHFLGSSQRGDSSLAPGATFDRDDVHRVLEHLDYTGIDASRTMHCLYLPSGVILDTHAADGVGDDTRRTGRAARQRLGSDPDDKDSSLEGLGGYHGSAHINGTTTYFAVAVYSEQSGHSVNGIPYWPTPWKNIVATMYHELCEARTDPDVEEAIRQNADALLGWYSNKGGEIGDIPMSEAGAHLGRVMVEVPLTAGGTAPIQLMWSNTVGGPCGPF